MMKKTHITDQMAAEIAEYVRNEGRWNIKRITDEEIRSAYNKLKMKSPDYIPEIDRMVADAQLQADLKALEDSREKLAETLWVVLRDWTKLPLSVKSQWFELAELADQIISLIKQE